MQYKLTLEATRLFERQGLKHTVTTFNFAVFGALGTQQYKFAGRFLENAFRPFVPVPSRLMLDNRQQLIDFPMKPELLGFSIPENTLCRIFTKARRDGELQVRSFIGVIFSTLKVTFAMRQLGS